ncbi:MAG TPA: YciI family protein [Bryobacteraceae bacterium]|nr:YciI family protein [Bryobacteraceae bacterium]
MKYLCIIFFDEKKLNALPKPEYEALINERLANADVLRNGGHLLANQALQSVRAAATIRLQGGKMMITDGPFAETREQIGGFILIAARDLTEAIQLASGIPAVRFGGVEVWPSRS